VAAGQSRVPEGDRAQESDSARGVVQLTLTFGFQEYRRCGELDGGVDDTPALGHDFLADPVTGSQRYGASCAHLRPPRHEVTAEP
jgi:hypothetical protein